MLNDLSMETVEFCAQLTKLNPTWLRGNTAFLELLKSKVAQTLERLSKHTQLTLAQQLGVQRNHYILPLYHVLMVPSYQQYVLLDRYCTILVAYCEENPRQADAVVALLQCFKHDRKGKVRAWVERVAMHGSLATRRMLLQMWLDSL